MKKNNNKFRLRFNGVITAILGLMGITFTGCFAVKYGPVMLENTLDIDGEVINEQNEPLKSVQVIMRTHRLGTIDSLHTNDAGKFNATYALLESGNDTLQIVINDTSNVYAPETLQIPFTDMELESESEWSKCYDLDIDIQLKKK